ncbi:hypothetical protein [Streptomyces sp. NRRL F-2580]|uniref:hypothetical protein n=1 Tax=Streptomyces sp. NRRL F-2580 TaxID=1463841 RepID=UPI000AD189A4|nr:hypothetical protein [Streptomyces sp. NRRL F-2580]
MNHQGEELLARVRAVLSDAGFEEIATGSEAVHLIRHACGVMVGWLPEEVSQPPRRRGPRRGRPAEPPRTAARTRIREPGGARRPAGDALVAHGSAEDIAHRVQEHVGAGADHVSLRLMTTTPDSPPARQWQQLAMRLPA